MKRSISDDDLCATCKYCRYHPGSMSSCQQFEEGMGIENDWPAVLDADGYAQDCSFYRLK